MKLHPREVPSNLARATFTGDVLRLLEASDMTDVEIGIALNELQGTVLTWLLRRERHPRHQCKAGEACERKGCPGSK